MNKCMAELQGQARFEHRTPRRKARTITTELSLTQLFCIVFDRDEAMHEAMVSHTMLKKLSEKEKMLVTSIFSYSHVF